MPLLDSPALRKLLTASVKLACSHFVDKECWNEKGLLPFYATIHILGYNRDSKTWVLEWMSGDVHHEAKAQDIIELTSLPTPGELYESGCQLNRDELQIIFQRPEPNMS